MYLAMRYNLSVSGRLLRGSSNTNTTPASHVLTLHNQGACRKATTPPSHAVVAAVVVVL